MNPHNAPAAGDTQEIQRRLDQGIRLAQQRLVSQAKHDGHSLVVIRDGKLQEIPATDI